MNGLTKTSLSVAHPVVRPIRGGLSRPLAARSRKAFTLVEVLMVIGIIAILAAMATYGVNNALNATRRGSCKMEMSQIEVGLANAARELGGAHSIPSYIILKDDLTAYDLTDALQAASFRQLTMMFPGLTGPVDWNGNGVTTDVAILKADQAWVFFVGGIPSSTGPDGFSRGANPSTPGGKRKGPYFDFKTPRLVKQANGFYTYQDYWEKNAYLVYANYGKDPASFFNTSNIDAPTYITPSPNRYFLKSTKMFNPTGYQIVSAGKDGVFGTAQSGSAPGANGFVGYGDGDTTGGADDQANFSDSPLAKPID